MTTALQVQQPKGGLQAYNEDQIRLIKNQVAKGATDEELSLFLYAAQKRGLDPLAKQLHFRKSVSKNGEAQIAFMTSIDSYRLIAARTGVYVGSDEAIFTQTEGKPHPDSAKVTVYRLVNGVRCPFTATVHWEEFYPGEAMGFMWRKMPKHMLGKVAESHALRKAFPEELSDLYVQEELDKHMPEHNPALAVQVVKDRHIEDQAKAYEQDVKDLQDQVKCLWQDCIDLKASNTEVMKVTGYPSGAKLTEIKNPDVLVTFVTALREYRGSLGAKA